MDLMFPLDRMFLRILCMSLSGAFVIVFVLLARLVLRRAPKWCTMALWAVVLVRLFIPFSVESPFTLLPVFARPVTLDIYYEAQPAIHTGIAALNSAVSSSLPAATPYASINPIQVYTGLATLVWVLGVVLGLVYLLVSSLRLREKLRSAVHLEKNWYAVTGLETPFVAGVLRPRIFLPAQLPEADAACVLAHEQMHVHRRDPLWKVIGFLAVCLHWYNPLVWAAFFLAARDLELACDEAVVRGMNAEEKKTYCSCLLAMATGQRPGLTPTAFSEGDVTKRIRRVLVLRRPPKWLKITLLAVVTVCALALLTNPVSAVRSRYKVTKLTYGQEIATVRADGLGQAAVMDLMVKSSAWPPATAVAEHPICYRVRQTLREGWRVENHDYYAYVQDGRSVMQGGLDGMYTSLSPELYGQLEALFVS